MLARERGRGGPAHVTPLPIQPTFDPCTRDVKDVLRLARVRVSARALVAPADGSDAIAIQARNRIARQSVKTNRATETIAAITGLVELSSRYAWPVILTFLLLAIA